MEHKSRSDNRIYSVNDLVQRLYADHSYEKAANTMYSQEIAGINKITSDNFHLMHLLTTNPAAALPPLFTSSLHTEHMSSYKFLTLERRTSTIVYPETFLTPLDTFQTTRNGDRGDLVKSPYNVSQLFATEEEIEKKGTCWGGEGKDFDFEALLPANYR